MSHARKINKFEVPNEWIDAIIEIFGLLTRRNTSYEMINKGFLFMSSHFYSGTILHVLVWLQLWQYVFRQSCLK